jgi:hypothetical protein
MKDKFTITERLLNGGCVTKLAQEYGVGKSIISGLKKQIAAIESFMRNLDSTDGSSMRKTTNLAENTKLHDAVYKSFLQKRSTGEPISGPLLCENELLFSEKISGPSTTFQASTEWLKCFKSRHGIRELHIEGEKLSSDKTAAETFKKAVRELVEEEGYSMDNIYNADETGLNWKALPRKTLASLRESAAPGFKVSKDRITLKSIIFWDVTPCSLSS